MLNCGRRFGGMVLGIFFLGGMARVQSMAQNQPPAASATVLTADVYPGSDCGARIEASLRALGGRHGVIQIGDSCGDRIDTPVHLGENSLHFQVKRRMQISATMTLGTSASLSGIPMASNSSPVELREADGVNLPCLIEMGSGSTIENLMLDGNKANNPSGGDLVCVTNANRVNIRNATLRNAARDNLHVTSTMYPAPQPNHAYAVGDVVSCNQGDLYRLQVITAGVSGGAYPNCPTAGNATFRWGTAEFRNLGPKLDGVSGSGYLGPNVLLIDAGRDDFFGERQGDWIIAPQVEFEGAGRDGIHGEDFATLRLSNDDIGANLRYGIYQAVVHARCSTGVEAANWIITNSQFGLNGRSGTGGDIYEDGSAVTSPGFCSGSSQIEYAGKDTIVGNNFAGLGATQQSDSITLIDAGGNTIVGNTWGDLLWSHAYRYAVAARFLRLSDDHRQGSMIVGNNIVNHGVVDPSHPYLLADGIDVAEGITAPGTLTTWGNRVIEGNLRVTGSIASGARARTKEDASQPAAGCAEMPSLVWSHTTGMVSVTNPQSGTNWSTAYTPLEAGDYLISNSCTVTAGTGIEGGALESSWKFTPAPGQTYEGWNRTTTNPAAPATTSANAAQIHAMAGQPIQFGVGLKRIAGHLTYFCSWNLQRLKAQE